MLEEEKEGLLADCWLPAQSASGCAGRPCCQQQEEEEEEHQGPFFLGVLT